MLVFKAIVGVLIVVVWAWGWMRIFARAGHRSRLGLLMAVPVVNVILWLWFAFGDQWPVQRERTLLAARAPQKHQPR
jgi:hypothetical protein